MSENAKGFGTYRINSTDFPAPITSWDEQPIAAGLNAIPILASYKIHRMRWAQLESAYAAELYSLFASQQSGNSQLDSIETDPYDASLATAKYGTQQYTDVIIQSLSSRTRGLPNYDDVEAVFEVYVA